jgi:hypothetical protein
MVFKKNAGMQIVKSEDPVVRGANMIHKRQVYVKVEENH